MLLPLLTRAAEVTAGVATELQVPVSTKMEVMPAPSSTPGLIEADAASWLDGVLPCAIGRADIPDAVVVVVKDGKILVQKGYGYSDVASRTPVDPATTLFRPGHE